ncbi:MAG: hypothetical protein AB7E96_05450 [Deferribacterales bacterium]
MSSALKALFLATMTIALSFGFMHHAIHGYDFERLHIFLFNLCSGGTIILYYTMDRKDLPKRLIAFYLLAVAFAVLAFFRQYILCIIIAFALFGIVESIRYKKFSFFGREFFSRAYPVAVKFHHAALLCLSIGLLISIFAMVNEEYYRMLDFEKLTLNTFFLGFSFPSSLITLSVMFSTMKKLGTPKMIILKTALFWIITVGVIVFFGFILFEAPWLELGISLLLFVAVSAVLVLYVKTGFRDQQKAFLTSGIVFLVMTAVSGVIYIIIYAVGYTDPMLKNITILYHRFLSLYGWNISGLAVICRFRDFPIMLHSGKIIALHWLIVGILAPVGVFIPAFAVLAVLSYLLFLFAMFFSRPTAKVSEIQP